MTTKFKIIAKIRWKHLNSNEIHWDINGTKYVFSLTNLMYEKVIREYIHTPGRAFNIAKQNDLNKESTMKGEE